MSLKIPTFVEALTAMRSHGRDTDAPWEWDGLIGNWMTLQGGGGLLYDTSGYNNHGTLTNMDPATDWTVDQTGYVLDYSSSADKHVFCGSNILFGPTGSISMRLTHTSASGFSFIWDTVSGDDQVFFFWNGNDYHWGIGGSSDIGSGAGFRTVGQPYHLVITWDSSQSPASLMYIDGIEVNTSTVGFTAPGVKLPFRIGSRHNSALGAIARIGDTGRWNRMLLPSEIQRMYVDPHARVRPRAMWFPSAVVAPPTGGTTNPFSLGAVNLLQGKIA